jgi:pyrroloquinoline-quinone synthase
MAVNLAIFLEELDRQIENKHLLKHPFYLAWSQGKLSQKCLKDYALQYYHHVKAFPTYLSSLHARTEDAETRQQIVKNLNDEEGGSPTHPELWETFALSLGVTQEEIGQHSPNLEIAHLIATFREICQKGSVAEAVAVLYAYESQVPAICLSKIEGLKRFYHLDKPENWSYFSVHAEADIEHASIERALLVKHLDSSMMSNVQKSVQRILDGLWDFLSELCHRYQIAM